MLATENVDRAKATQTAVAEIDFKLHDCVLCFAYVSALNLETGCRINIARAVSGQERLIIMGLKIKVKTLFLTAVLLALPEPFRSGTG